MTVMTRFNNQVTPGGYAWWYIDAVSDDGKHALSVIAFIGSVFSPYYAWQRRRHGAGNTDPNAHCAINVALYDLSHQKRTANHWTMTERNAASTKRDAHQLQIGPSALRWENGVLVADVHEFAAPIPRRVSGQFRITPSVDVHAQNHTIAIDGEGAHFWQPLAPTARISVAFAEPALRWSGHAYIDSNYGHVPLEATFRDWQWARATLADGSTAVSYDVTLADGGSLNVARRYRANGDCEPFTPSVTVALPTTRWGIHRACQSTLESAPSITATLESGPFYARSLVAAHWLGEPVTAVHESLSLTRFTQPTVQAMLPFRMPRWAAPIK